MSARDRYRIVRPFLDATVVPDTEVIDGYHPLALPLHVWKKWFNRVKTWQLSASGTSFSALSAAMPIGASGAIPAQELNVVAKQLQTIDLGFPARWPWVASFFVVDPNPPSGDIGGTFFLYSPQSQGDLTAVNRINAMHWNADGSRVAASLIFRCNASVDTVGTAELSSVPGEIFGADTVVPLIIDPDGYNVALSLSGRDQIGLSLTLTPAEYWSFRGIYNTSTGAVNPGQRVWQNTPLP